MADEARRARGVSHARTITIIAQDPDVRVDGKILLAEISIPAEMLMPGPCGYRVNVIDYDASADAVYAQADLTDESTDLIARASERKLLNDPRLHAQNAYAIVMRTLARFEFALGRRVPWGCDGHQLHVAPHAFAEPNAFYSRDERALFFGYFQGRPRGGGKPPTIYTCLSHDVVAHETTHAILDGLRARYLEPSLPDQAGFHEGFADVVALLSVFALPVVVGALLDGRPDDKLISASRLTEDRLLQSALFGLAEQMGSELAGLRGNALRRSAALPPGRNYMSHPDYQEEHARGELLVAAMLRSFLQIWLKRIARLGTFGGDKKDRSMVVEEGARAADHLLTMAIRAIDYCPPVDLGFGDFLSALLTVDREVVPDDRYGYRDALLKNFADYGIKPADDADFDGTWAPFPERPVYHRTHFDSMLRDREEVFRFVWENRGILGISDIGDAANDGYAGYLEVQSVRASTRVAPDGFLLRETIAEYVQVLTLTAEELRKDLHIDVPDEIEHWRRLRVYGGGTLVFDEYGQLKYQIAHHVARTAGDRDRQVRRLRHLWETGFFEGAPDNSTRISRLHLARGVGRRVEP